MIKNFKSLSENSQGFIDEALELIKKDQDKLNPEELIY